MNIVHVVYSLKYGGIETMLVNIVNEQVRYDDASIYIFIINDCIDKNLLAAIDKRVKVIRIDRPVGSKNPYYLLKANLVLLRIHADIIHFHLSLVGQILWLPLFKNKSVYTQHALIDPNEIHYIRNFPRIVAISEGVKDSLLNFGFNSNVVYNGIIPSNFCHINTSKKDLHRIVTVGRLDCSVKGQDILVMAVKELTKSGVDNFHVDIIGDGESRVFLEDLIKKEGIEDFISLLGAKSPDYIAVNLCNYDLFVQPSRKEGFGLTITEAMASKVPVLTSDQDGPMEVIGNGEYGYYFKTNDSKSCASQIKQILFSDSSKIVEKAYQRVISDFSVSNTVKQYIKLYQEV